MGPITLDAPASGGQGTFVQYASVSQQSVTSSTSVTQSQMGGGNMLSGLAATASQVQAGVDALLTSIDGELAGDQQLRMMIAMLILQALLGKDDDQPANKAAELAGLAAGLNAFGHRTNVAMFSSTNIIQMQHQSTLLFTDQAIQTLTHDETGSGQSMGTELDLSA